MAGSKFVNSMAIEPVSPHSASAKKSEREFLIIVYSSRGAAEITRIEELCCSSDGKWEWGSTVYCEISSFGTYSGGFALRLRKDWIGIENQARKKITFCIPYIHLPVCLYSEIESDHPLLEWCAAVQKFYSWQKTFFESNAIVGTKQWTAAFL